MYSPRLIFGCFTLAGINSFGTTLYFYYLYFFTERQFGFSKLQNLVLAALVGGAYGLSSIFGGRFAQRRGYFTSVKTGYAIMAVTIACSAFVTSLPWQFPIMFVAVFGMALTWPALEALVSEGRPRRELQRNVGIYNLTWGATAAAAYFCGGAIASKVGFKGMFLMAAGIHVLQFVLAMLLERAATRVSITSQMVTPRAAEAENHREQLRSPVRPETFLKMAWLANPFAYLAINTVIAVIPNVAGRLELSVMWAGIFCSIWLFVRTLSFGLLWLWPGWHYRFRWLAGSYLAMSAGFVALLFFANLWIIVIAQVVFGFALGLIYYSSLYYSMDVGDTKGEHGGLHEAMIGAGSFAGPAIGATAQYCFKDSADSSTWAVGALLCAGFVGLMVLRWRKASAAHP